MSRKLADLDFANDIVQLASSIHNLQEPVTNIAETATGMGLSIICKKTKNVPIGEHLMPSDVSIGQSKLEVVENYMPWKFHQQPRCDGP